MLWLWCENMSLSKFKLAGQAEILRAAQKDENYIRQLNEVISNIALNLGGKRFWLNNACYLVIVAKLIYYASTSLGNLQTLGEEYTGIIPVQSSLQKLLTFQKMLLYVILLSGGHTHVQKILTDLENVTLPDCMLSYINGISPLHGHYAVRIFRHLIPYIQRLNKCIFYWNGSYYSLVNRILGVKHVLIHSWLKDEASPYGFKILACVSFANLIVSFMHTYPSWLKPDVSVILPTSEKQASNTPSKNICQLCLCERRSTSITPCGHLFCWTCIMNWLKMRKDCPMCKSSVIPSRITFLMNYDKCA